MTALARILLVLLLPALLRAGGGFACLVPSLTDMIVELGRADRLCAVSRYCQLPVSLDSLPRVGAYLDPNLEALIALQPEGVLLANRGTDFEQRLRELGLTVHLIPQDSLAQILEGVTQLGDLLECPVAAAGLRTRLETGLRPVPVLESGRPSVLIVASRNLEPGPPGQVWAIGRGSWLSELVDLAGGCNLMENTSPALPALSREGLIALQPDLILDLWPELPPGRTAGELAADWSAWPELKAVSRGRVLIVRDRCLVVPGPDLPEALQLIRTGLAGVQQGDS